MATGLRRVLRSVRSRLVFFIMCLFLDLFIDSHMFYLCIDVMFNVLFIYFSFNFFMLQFIYVLIYTIINYSTINSVTLYNR